ncbi:hypothetical protein FRC10_010124 [Ceratobasidium sp. 414]|nr:hypothetical protein FRC10_010124 [Ceratobasidium sp. 414]
MNTIEFIATQYERLLDLSFLTPAVKQHSHARDALVWYLPHSDATRWAKLLGCKIFECIVDGASRQKLGLYVCQLQGLDQRLRSTPDQHLTPAESYSRLAGILDASFLKMMFVNGTSTYQILHETAPIFLQLVFVDSSLWLDPTDFTSLSLAHVLASTHYELGRFVLVDALYSMAYGLPQVIEYDTSAAPFMSDVRPVEWVHGCPVVLTMALVDINKRCNARRRVTPESDWRPIEHRIKSWMPETQAAPSGETWKSIARLAVHESWRHVSLIYLYMGVCGVKSDDYRVQASVRQVFQLTNSIKGFERPLIDIHFLAQYLISPDTTFYYKHRQAHALAAKHIATWLEKDLRLLLTTGSGSFVDLNLYPYSTTFGTAQLQMVNQFAGVIMSTRDRLHSPSLLSSRIV